QIDSPVPLPLRVGQSERLGLPLVFTRDGRQIVAVLETGAVGLISAVADPPAGSVIRQSPLAESAQRVGVPNQLFLLDHAARLVSRSDRGVWLWETATMEPVSQISTDEPVSVTPDQKMVILVEPSTSSRDRNRTASRREDPWPVVRLSSADRGL